MTSPRVSIIIPTYNCDRYLPEAIASVLAQTFCAYEVIVVDDGSTDRTAEVLAPYRSQIRYLQQANQGVSAARNRGIQEAQGEWIAFLDADDYFLPDKLAHQILLAESDPDLGLIHSGWRRVDPEGRAIADVTLWEEVPVLDLEHWLRWKPVLPSAMLFRRDWLERVGGFDRRFSQAEDTDLVLRLAYAGCPAAWLPEITVCYRQHPRSASRSGVAQARAIATILEEFFARPHLPATIRRLEAQVCYNTLVWSAWYLYHTQNLTEMVATLQAAWARRQSPTWQTVTHWLECFTEYSQRAGEPLDASHLVQSPAWQSLTRWVIDQIEADLG